jgi:hypothetical protein
MHLAEIQNKLIGEWTGDNLLRLSWLTPSDFQSRSRLTVTSVVKGKFLTIFYTWSYDNAPQEGQLTLGYDEAQGLATAAWCDSWHQSARLLFCQGSITESGDLELLGSYAAPPGPDWGWRIVISSPDGEDLKLTMYNVSPEGVEDLAVNAEYKRL